VSFLEWLLRVGGIDDTAGPWYALWSGFGSDIAELAIVAAIFRKINCHARGCWRIGLHRVPGTPYTTCARHNPAHRGDKAPTAEHIASAHAAAKHGQWATPPRPR
jgi:hypothetical protein